MKRVLFVCIGNSCRSPMAEGFARRYGSDVLIPASAGLAPAAIVQSLTKKVMAAKNINLDQQFPKDIDDIDLTNFDLVINMSGTKVPTQAPVEIRSWKVDDPIGREEEVYQRVCDEIEHLVMRLILELRREVRKSLPQRARPRFRAVTEN